MKIGIIGIGLMGQAFARRLGAAWAGGSDEACGSGLSAGIRAARALTMPQADASWASMIER